MLPDTMEAMSVMAPLAARGRGDKRAQSISCRGAERQGSAARQARRRLDLGAAAGPYWPPDRSSPKSSPNSMNTFSTRKLRRR